jgi:hypothetical protein
MRWITFIAISTEFKKKKKDYSIAQINLKEMVSY